jgi:hypothetical protein
LGHFAVWRSGGVFRAWSPGTIEALVRRVQKKEPLIGEARDAVCMEKVIGQEREGSRRLRTGRGDVGVRLFGFLQVRERWERGAYHRFRR